MNSATEPGSGSGNEIGNESGTGSTNGDHYVSYLQAVDSSDHQLSQLLAKELPIKQENDISIDELDKMISETMNQDENFLQHQKRTIDEVIEQDGDEAASKRQSIKPASGEVEDLDIEFEKAIENHHRENVAPRIDADTNERDELRMIVNEFHGATSGRHELPDVEEEEEIHQQQQQKSQKDAQQPQESEMEEHEIENVPETRISKDSAVDSGAEHISKEGENKEENAKPISDTVEASGTKSSEGIVENAGIQTQSQSEIQPPPQPQVQVQVQAQSETETQAPQPQPQSQSQSQHLSQSQSQSSSELQAQTQTESRIDSQPESHPESQSRAEQHVEHQADQQTQNQPETEPQTQTQTDDNKAQINLSARLETQQHPQESHHSNSNTETTQDKNTSEDKESVVHEGVTIPADSELLNTNTAFAAYNALSSQLPPLATLSGAHLAALPISIMSPDFLPPRIQLLINTLPTLDNLASQLLRIVAMGPYQKILDLVAQPDTPQGATYRDLTSLFEFTKKLYSEEDPFLTVEHIAPGIWKQGDKTPAMFRFREQSIELTLRKVNLATFLGATLGTLEVGFFYLNEIFLDVFCPLNTLDPQYSLSNMTASDMRLQNGHNTIVGDVVGKLLKPQAVLYLDLKTQAYISAIDAGERSKEEILEDILPRNMEEILLNRRNTKALTPTEMDFVERCKSRKDTLLHYPLEKDLSEEYEWLSFLKDLFEYSSKNMGFLIWGKRSRLSDLSTSLTSVAVSTSLDNTPHSQEIINSVETQKHERELEAERQRVLAVLQSNSFNEISNVLLPSEIQQQQIHLRANPRLTVRNIQRRPWTVEEEKALRHALELKGPMWSTILDLFGAGGKISEALKNRTQVQLKDKARNWKMFFLKSGLPVPKYLHKVTGDLDREDSRKIQSNSKMSKKTAAAPIPSPMGKK